jgi:hypothetical protein
VADAGVVDSPGCPSPALVHAHAHADGAIDGVIHNFSPGPPSDIVLG